MRHGLEVVLIERARCTSPQRVWSQKATVDVSMLLLKAQSIRACSNRSVNYYYYYYYHYHHHHYYCCCCCCSWWWYLLLGSLVLRPSILSLLQSATVYFYYICDGLLLQSATTLLLQSATSVVTKCDRCYKVRTFYYKVLRLLLSATEHLFHRLVAVMKFKFSTHKIYLWDLWIYTQLAISDLTKCNNQFLTFLSESVAFMYLIVSQIQHRRSLLPCCPREVWEFGDVTAYSRVQLSPSREHRETRLSLISFSNF